jgi:hypothetical protein
VPFQPATVSCAVATVLLDRDGRSIASARQFLVINHGTDQESAAVLPHATSSTVQMPQPQN